MRRFASSSLIPAALALSLLLSAPRTSLGQSAESRTRAVDPDAQELNRLLADAQVAVSRQDFGTAAKDYQDYLAKKPDDATVHFNLGYAYTALQRLDDAKTEYEKAIALAPNDPKMAPAYQNLGLTLLPTDPAAAVDPLQHAAQLMPNDARTKWLLGIALENSGKLDPSIEQYQAARKLDPKDVDVCNSLGHALLAADRPADAEVAYHDAIALRPSGVALLQASHGLVQALIAEKKSAEAAAALDDYLKLQPKDTAARLDRASLLVDSGKYDDALAELDRAAAQGPESLRALKLRSTALYQEKRYDDLLPVVQKASAMAPADANVAAQLGQVYLAKKDYPHAVPPLVTAHSLDPTATDILGNLVEAEYGSGNYQAALQALDLLSKRMQLPAGSWFIRAACYDKLGQLAPALDAYQRFLQLNKDETSDMYFVSTSRVRFIKRELEEKKR